MKNIALLYLLVAVARLAATPANAQSAASQPWQAQWLGTATLLALDLADASWIWADEPGVDATRNAKAGTLS